MDAIQINVFGIKCDACDYQDDTVKYEDYPEWLNKPCPKCGANLLTEEDYATTKMVVEMVNVANLVLPQTQEDTEKIALAVDMNGTGEVKVRLKETDK